MLRTQRTFKNHTAYFWIGIFAYFDKIYLFTGFKGVDMS